MLFDYGRLYAKWWIKLETEIEFYRGANSAFGLDYCIVEQHPVDIKFLDIEHMSFSCSSAGLVHVYAKCLVRPVCG